MQFNIEGPPAMEAVEITSAEKALKIRPLTVRGQHTIRACYITASGDGGTSAKAVILFNGNTGEFSVQRLDAPPVPFAFDKSPNEFAARREASKKASKEKKNNQIGKPGTPP